MGLLTVCAQHYEGLAWLLGFYALLCYLPLVHRLWNPTGALVHARKNLSEEERLAGKQSQARSGQAGTRQSLVREALYLSFFSAVLFVGSTLPCGRFYYESAEGFFGNALIRLSYEYLYLYLGGAVHAAERLERWYAALPRWLTSFMPMQMSK